MLIIGAKGFAKEVLEILFQNNYSSKIFFFDNVTEDLPQKLFNEFDIIRSIESAKRYFQEYDNKFTLGVGNPATRFSLAEKFIKLGGVLENTISPYARIGHFGNSIGNGINIMTGVCITNEVTVNDGCLINLNCTIGHNSILGKFSELSPGVHISGNCIIGEFCNIGTGAVILPKVSLGNHVIVGAGSVVTKDVADYDTVVGIPAKRLIK
jgi:sugar O-acyltransferase (sialic acid O-acetyltransferase NeuD family)